MSLERPPSAKGWIHEIKFDGYHIQMRVLGGDVTLKTRNRLDWTAKYSAIARTGTRLPDAIIDGEICALDESGAPDFAALQEALSEGKTDALVYFAFDLLVEDDEDLRPLPLTKRKERLQQLLADAGDDTRLRFVEHFETGGEAVLRSACRLSLEGIGSSDRSGSLESRSRSGRDGSAGSDVASGETAGFPDRLVSVPSACPDGFHFRRTFAEHP